MDKPYPGMSKKLTKRECLDGIEEERKKKGLTKKVEAKLLPKIIKKIKSGDYLLSPRSYNYITLKTKRGEGAVVLPNYSFKAEALIDLIFHTIAEQLKFGAEPKEYDIIPVEEFKAICETGEKLPIFKPIIFTTSEMRKKLNVSSDWTDKKIVEASYELRDKPINVGGSKIYYDEVKKYLEKVNWREGICSAILTKETKEIAPRTKNVQHEVGFIPGFVTSLLFYNDVTNRRYSLFPTKLKKFYRIGEEPVRLYRYLSLWNFVILTLPMAMEILRYSEKTNVTQMCRQVQGHLDKLADRKLIEFWMRDTEKKGMETTWYVFVTQTVEQIFGRWKKEKSNKRTHHF